MKTITLKTNDTNPSYSPSGTILDELAYACGQWTEEDLRLNNYDYANEGNSYINEHFNFEDALLKATKTIKELENLILLLKTETTLLLANEKTGGLQAGAYYALNYPNQWTTLLREYEDKCKEEQYNFYDSEFLEKYAPDYVKELQDSEDSFWKDLRHEWLYGGRERDNNGILYEIKKYFGAEDITFDEKNWDEITLNFDEDELHEQYCGCGEDKCKEKPDYKKDILAHIQSSSKNKHNAEMKGNAERKAERERLAEYKAKQKAEAEAERKAKLLALKK